MRDTGWSSAARGGRQRFRWPRSCIQEPYSQCAFTGPADSLRTTAINQIFCFRDRHGGQKVPVDAVQRCSICVFSQRSALPLVAEDVSSSAR
jgi:hypothetical protein